MKTSGSGANFIDITGQRFGRWVVQNRTPQLKTARWVCKCDCGTVREVIGTDLRSGKSASCGCMWRDLVCRPESLVKRFPGERNSWAGMRQRCNYSGHIEFHRYGGRGIKVCDRWSSFEAFLEDMGPRPEGHSLDRVDLDGDYTPENCRWSSSAEQSRNTSRNVRVEYQGRAFTLKELARHLGLSYFSLHGYYRRKRLSLEAAIAYAAPEGASVSRPRRKQHPS